MDSSYLLVIDNSAERIQAINSFLRNAGVVVRVINATNVSELETILQEKSPFLIMLGAQLPDTLKINQVLAAAHANKTPVVLQLSPGGNGTVDTTICTHPLLVINTEDNEQLMEVVQQYLSDGKSSREYDKLRHRLDELQQRYHLLLDSARDAIAYIHEGLHVYANRAYLELLQLKTLADIEGLSLLELVTTDDGTDLKKLLRDMNKDIIPGDTLTVTIKLPDGKNLKADLTFLAASFEGEKCIQMMVCEQDAKLALREELDKLRKTDQLTQMFNRKAFTDSLSKFIEIGHNEELHSVVLYVEADGMAHLQQDIGTQNLDTYILDMANIIRACTGQDDLTARFSEYGFTLLISRADIGDIQTTSNAILENINNHVIDLGERTMSASCSIGMATIGSLTKNAWEVIDHARKAFKEATFKGNTLVSYKPALTTISTGNADRDWVERIRHAFNNHNFYTVQQSIVDLEGENEGLFANQTFMREDTTDTPVADFMPIAERNDLGSTIDRHIIPQLLAAIAGTGDKHIIPLSSNSINDFSFSHWFHGKLEEAEVVGSQLLLQISAITAESKLKPTQRVMEELQGMGCGIVLSEFDNDRRTVQLLEHLPVNMVKLRPGLAHGLSANTTNQEIIRAVVNVIATYENIIIIADEVQDATDLALLWQCGVKLVTGDFLNEAPQVVGQ